MAERRYEATRLTCTFIDQAGEPVQIGNARVPRWFDVRLAHPDWPTKHAVSHEMTVEIAVSVSPDTGPVLAGIRSGRGSTATYADALNLLKTTTDLERILQHVTSLAAGIWAARMVQGIFVGDVDASTPLADLDPADLGRLIWFRDGAAAAAQPATAPTRRRVVTPGLLKDVAEVYRAAYNAGNPPTAAVATHFVTSHRTATRWVGEARKAGFLGPADSTRPGELGDDDS